jgi:hypothetical protein
MVRRSLSFVVGLGFAVLFSLAAAAEEQVDYCIRCTNPDVIYVCRVHSSDGSAQGQQFFCIMSIAQQFHHDSCAANTQAGTCTGRLVALEAQQPGIPAAAAEQEPKAGAGPAAEPAQPLPATSEPKTLVEFSKQTVKATGKSLKSVTDTAGSALETTGEGVTSVVKKVGRNITKATDKTIKCVSSLFTQCGD